MPKHRDRQLWRYGLEEKPKGFQVIPRRPPWPPGHGPCGDGAGACCAGWVIERTFAWLSRSPRLARDCQRLPETSVAMIHAAMSRIMLRRLAG